MNYRLRIISVFVFIAILGLAVFSAPQTQEAVASDYSDHSVVLAYAEIITDPLSGEAGRVVWLQNDLGNGQLGHDFVYNDPRASWDSVEDISYGVKYGNTSADVNLSNQADWMVDSIEMWDNQTCANFDATEVSVDSGTPGLVEHFFNTGMLTLAFTEADLTQVGFMSAAEFPFFAANPNVLGVAFTLTWVDGNGNPSDIDNNGKVDVALREIYYNDEFEWADDGVLGERGSGFFDFPAVAIHEAGHGLSVAHFGNIGLKDGALFAEPRTIMNAIYGGIQHELLGRDLGSLCSNWAQWPIN